MKEKEERKEQCDAFFRQKDVIIRLKC